MQINHKLKEAYDILIKNKRSLCIIVHCPPKVGSTTLVTSLRVSLGKIANVIHLHDEIMLGVLTGIKNISVNEIIDYISLQVETLYVIDIYRTPIERKISEFFDKLSFHFNNSEENISKYNIQLLIDRFNKLFPYLAVSEHYLDRYNIPEPTPFDFDNKYTLQQINNIQYLKLRLVDVSLWSSILSNLLKTHVVIINDYLTSNKLLGNKYAEFKKEYKLPSNFHELLLTDKNLLFYFNKDERTTYLNSYNRILDRYVKPYTYDEYVFYLDITLRNQFYDTIEINHYIDNGCFCNACTLKRREIYTKAIKGEIITDKINHAQCVYNMKSAILEKIKEKMVQAVKRRGKSNTININTSIL